MMEDCEEAKVFSVRIVTMDYYMSPPIPNLDISYSTFQGGKVNEVPVIRIYGSTPAGQKTCLHVHRALPYLYIPCADLKLPLELQGDARTNLISKSIEKALKLKGAGSKRQHVHDCSLVRAKRLYGYYKSDEVFAKIYLYRPQDVSRAANLLLEGGVFDRSVQPHESHIPFLLQFLVDYNLYGMAHLHVSKLKFRQPVPNVTTQRKISSEGVRDGLESHPYMSSGSPKDSSGNLKTSSPIWISSTIPDSWMWQSPSQLDSHLFKHQSSSELEGDAIVNDILNQQNNIYTTLSQTSSDVKMVQSLIPIWEEEYERSGMHEAALFCDTDKPLPEDALKTLSNGLDFYNQIFDLYNETEKNSSPLPFENDVGSAECRTDLTNNGNMVILIDSEKDGIRAKEFLKIDELVNLLPNNSSFEDAMVDDTQSQAFETIGSLDAKIVDKEAIGLLSWLASSQAGEDINSDDELAFETILSPLLPATSMDKVLEKANVNFESESQKECQDILDSVDIDHGDLNETSSSTDQNHLNYSCSEKIIPQVDGSSDDRNLVPDTDESQEEYSCNENVVLSHVNVASESSSGSKAKNVLRKSLWGSLPFSSNQNVDTIKSSKLEFEGDAINNESKAETGLVGCSVRDLMRRKRRPLFEPYKNDSKNFRHASLEEEQDIPKELEVYAMAYSKEEEGSQEIEAINENRYRKKLSSNSFEKVSSVILTYPHHSSFDLGMGKPLKLMKSEDQDSVLSLGPFEKDKTFESDIFGRGCCVVENYHKCESYRESKAEMTSKIVANMEVTVANVGHIKGGQCSNLSLPKNSAAPLVNFEANRKEINGLTSFKKLPVLDNKDEMSEGASPSLKAVSHISLDEEGDSGEKITVQRELEDKWIHPIIGGCCENASILSNNSTGEEKDESDDYRGVTGVPSQYLNGSYVYTLTPKASPPSVDEVSRWLLLNDSGYSNCEIKVDDFLGGNLEKSLQECTVVDSTKAQILGESSRNFKSFGEKENDQRQSECNTPNQRRYSDFSQDVSQISGPFGKLKATPLSQTGFRDPASFGMGQQLTLLSIEVQAESRGDLRSDPRFDAVNFIVLVFQEDGSSLIDVYVLIRINTDHERKNVAGITGCKMLAFLEEKQLFRHFIKFISSMDPDLIMGWDIQGGSLGFLAERAIHLGIKLLNGISRTPTEMNIADIDTGISDKETFESILGESMVTDSVKVENSIIEDEWGRTHASGVHVGGRIVLNIWRLMRGEVKLNMYTFEAVADAVLRKKIPLVQSKVLNNWFSSGPARARYRCIKYMIDRAKMNLEIMNQLDMINRTSELARVFGIEFFSVLSRGSQYRVESMLLRLARSQNYIAISPGFQQVASQPAMECIPLVMEPESAFYSDPVVVLDFQSLYPSMIIAYNLCFSTCLGNVLPSKANTLGVSSYSSDLEVLRELNVETMVTPNGVMYVPSKVRRGVLPRLLEEILSTRIMVKKAMKKLAPSQQVLYRIFNARQLALKLISNVTYGYTAAGFSGRMPCAEIADSIVQCGRKTLENAISFVNTHDKWKAKVVYGDTDSMFVLLKGRNVKEAFEIGQEIAAAVTAANPNPVTLKMEKVYHPCFLLTKKRYVGYSYENPDQVKPIFDAKGIETVRRDTCAAVAKTMEQSLRLFFEQQQVDKVKAYLLRQWKRIFSGRVSLQDFIFAKEVRLGTYSSNASASLPPAAIVATKAMREDPRAEPRYAERIPYVVVHGEPGSRLVDMVVDPLDLLALDSAYRLNSMYYIKKQIIPALQRVFGLVGADLNQWLFDMPRPGRESGAKRKAHASTSFRTRIDYYYLSKHCILCGEIVQGSAHVCGVCLKNEAAVASAIVGRTSKLEKNIHHLSAICRHCGGGDWVLECGVKCTSLACTLFYERRKVQKEMQSLCAVATEAGLYPTCMVEWF